MSYDYNSFVQQIIQHRSYGSTSDINNNDSDVNKNEHKFNHLQKSIELFETLSSTHSCPLTPLLWMQYGCDVGYVIHHLLTLQQQQQQGEEEEGGGGEYDTIESLKSGYETTCQILELGILEFPSCALLRLYHLDILCTISLLSTTSSTSTSTLSLSSQDEECTTIIETLEKIHTTYKDTIQHIALGSHRNEDLIICGYFNLYLNFLGTLHHHQSITKQKQRQQDSQIVVVLQQYIQDAFLQRSCTPMINHNDSLVNEFTTYIQYFDIVFSSSSSPAIMDYNRIIGNMEQQKKITSKNFAFMQSLEFDIDSSMIQEHVFVSNHNHNDNYLMDELQRLHDLWNNDLVSLHPNDDDYKVDHKTTLNWSQILKQPKNNNPSSYLMGNGMMETASSFMKLIQSIINKIRKLHKENDDNHNKMVMDQDNDKDQSSDSEGDDRKEYIQKLNSIIIPLYERALSECPTVEFLWIKYINHLRYVLSSVEDKEGNKSILHQKVQNVCSRSVRNCPYSVKLYIQKMKQSMINPAAVVGDLSSSFDTDKIMSVIKEAVESQFLPTPQSHLDVYMGGCRLVQERILHLISTHTSTFDFDDAEEIGGTKKKKKNNKKNDKSTNDPIGGIIHLISPELKDEIYDLLDDIREMYDAADSFLRKKYAEWTQGRAILYKNRAKFEALIGSSLAPYESNDEYDGSDEVEDEAVNCFEKLVRVHHPPHPNFWRSYIQYLSGGALLYLKTHNLGEGEDEDEDERKTSLGISVTTKRLRIIRAIYKRALGSVKSSKKKQVNVHSENEESDIEYMIALRSLCDEFLDFEQSFGSEKSILAANKLIKVKFDMDTRILEQSLDVNIDTVQTGSKRKYSDDVCSDSVTKKAKISDPNDEVNIQSAVSDAQDEEKEHPCTITADNQGNKTESKPTNLKREKEEVPRVVVGNLSYPAHPYTIHVSNLSSETEDMDLVDLFKSRCGAVVHARIFREKHAEGGRKKHDEKPVSKNAGLVQFEERESVDKALLLNGEIGLHERLIHIDRSNQPAVNVVPPGMHRVNVQGHGKMSVVNMKRKERRQNMAKKAEIDESAVPVIEKDDQATDKHVTTNGSSKQNKEFSALSFRPRGVSQIQRKKKQISLV